jgi:hypothetical protein
MAAYNLNTRPKKKSDDAVATQMSNPGSSASPSPKPLKTRREEKSGRRIQFDPVERALSASAAVLNQAQPAPMADPGVEEFQTQDYSTPVNTPGVVPGNVPGSVLTTVRTQPRDATGGARPPQDEQQPPPITSPAPNSDAPAQQAAAQQQAATGQGAQTGAALSGTDRIAARLRVLDHLYQDPVQATNGKVKSGFLAFMENLNRGYLAQQASGQPWDAGAFGRMVGYGAGGFASGAINDTWDEKKQRATQIGEEKQRIGDEMAVEDNLSQIDARDADSASRQTNAQANYVEALTKLQNAGVENAWKSLKEYTHLDPKNPKIGALIQKLERAGYAIDVESWNRANKKTLTDPVSGAMFETDDSSGKWRLAQDSSGQAINPGNKPQNVDEVPKEFLTLDGMDEGAIKAKSRAEAGVFPKSTEIDPAKADLYGGMENLQNLWKLGQGPPLAQVMKDSAEGERRDQAIAAKEAPMLQRLNEYREAVRSVSRDKKAQKINIADFRSMYSVYQQALNQAAKLPESKRAGAVESVKRAFFQKLGNYRLTGPSE